MTTRRDFLAAKLIGAAGFAANSGRMFSAPNHSHSAPTLSETRSDRDFWNDWPAYITEEMNRARNRRLVDLAGVRSVAKVQERATMIHSKLWDLIGGPLEKTPLN